MKFYKQKNSKFSPGFVHPPDADGVERAQLITADGSVTVKKYVFFEFKENIGDMEKERSKVASLTKLNEKYKFSFK